MNTVAFYDTKPYDREYFERAREAGRIRRHDTERNTPAALHAYRQTRHLSADHWSLLTGKTDDVRELAALLGVNFRKDARGQFAHSNVITVLNPAGEIVHQQAGLNQDILATMQAIERASDPTKSKAHRIHE